MIQLEILCNTSPCWKSSNVSFKNNCFLGHNSGRKGTDVCRKHHPKTSDVSVKNNHIFRLEKQQCTCINNHFSHHNLCQKSSNVSLKTTASCATILRGKAVMTLSKTTTFGAKLSLEKQQCFHQKQLLFELLSGKERQQCVVKKHLLFRPQFWPKKVAMFWGKNNHFLGHYSRKERQ